jgi:hypothetical protein
VSPVKYELGIYIPEDDILHSHRCENLKSYTDLKQFELFGLNIHNSFSRRKLYLLVTDRVAFCGLVICTLQKFSL